jgi:hypothetical protein
LEVLGRFIVEPLVPVFRTVIQALDRRFVITDARLGAQGSTEVVRFRANLRAPVTIAGRVVYPFGSNGMPAGGYQVSCDAGGVLLYSALLLIVACAWPARRAQELAVRLLTCIPLVGVLLLIDVPTTVVAELREGVARLVDPGAQSGWMIWSRFLMGGGGIALSILLTVLAINAGRWFSRPPAGLRGAAARSRDQHERRPEQRI